MPRGTLHEGQGLRTTALAVGLPVAALSGRTLGTIAELSGTGFRVAGDNDVWLPLDVVFTVDRGRVTLICEREGLHRYALTRQAPGAA
jgi:hypothetical protein